MGLFHKGIAAKSALVAFMHRLTLINWSVAATKVFGDIHGGYLQGVLFSDWLRLLRRNYGSLDSRSLLRAAGVTANSVFNSVLHLHESHRYDSLIRETECHPPLFILGVWRSGTTHLHNLFSKDDRFAYPNYTQAMNPHTFLTAEELISRLTAPSLAETRGIDNMKTGCNQPEEDEYAILALSLLSCVLDAPFPQNSKFYARFRTFRRCSTREISRWQATLKFFVQKLTYKYNRPIVLKSPAHTGRVRMILEVFPDAKFVYIHRNPFDVFRSFRNAITKSAADHTLQSLAGDGGFTSFVIDAIKEINTAYYEERDLIPKSHLFELTYESLTDDPRGQMRNIYLGLDLPDFRVVEPALKDYLDTISGYERNKLSDLPAELQASLESEWSQYITEWRQSMEARESVESSK